MTLFISTLHLSLCSQLWEIKSKSKPLGRGQERWMCNRGRGATPSNLAVLLMTHTFLQLPVLLQGCCLSCSPRFCYCFLDKSCFVLFCFLKDSAQSLAHREVFPWLPPSGSGLSSALCFPPSQQISVPSDCTYFSVFSLRWHSDGLAAFRLWQARPRPVSVMHDLREWNECGRITSWS